MVKSVQFTPELAEEYGRLFDAMAIDPRRNSVVGAIYRRIARPENLSQYTAMQSESPDPKRTL